VQIDHWAYLHGKPTISASFKQQPSDFVVTEQLGYTPSGEGEHIYLWVEKQQLNTAYVAEQLAAFTQLPLRAVSYAGRKDKHAVCFQWFAIHKPGKTEYDWSTFTLKGLKVHKAMRHNKKLRIGQLKGNQFSIRLRDLGDAENIESRAEQIRQLGVPNYFGNQRFRNSRHHAQGGNLALGEQMLAGEYIRNRNKRNLAISALRAWLFNEFVHHRLSEGYFSQPMHGDVFCLAGSNSFFSSDVIDQALSERLEQCDIFISAPLWGRGELATQLRAKNWETTVANQYLTLCEQLEELGLSQERRSIHLMPQDLHWKLGDSDMTIDFSLPSGCFATSVLRELVNLGSEGTASESLK
jgi:tRNA pseudouridine13 synthase